MRRLAVALLIVVLVTSFVVMLISQSLAQESTETTPSPTTRWMLFRGIVTQWGDETYQGSITVRTKTLNIPSPKFKPWVTVLAIWSNESRPIASDPISPGEVTFTHYQARLVKLTALAGKQETLNLNITGIWNIKEVKITSEFDENSIHLKSKLKVTPISTKVMGQLLITKDWKEFDLEIEDTDLVKGIQISMITTTRMINPFSFEGRPVPSINDLIHIMKCFRSMPGFGNYDPELDYNADSKIDLADLTTVAANM